VKTLSQSFLLMKNERKKFQILNNVNIRIKAFLICKNCDILNLSERTYTLKTISILYYEQIIVVN